MAAIHESERAMFELQEQIHMDAAGNHAVKPNQLPIQSKMKHQRAAIEPERKMLPMPLNAKNLSVTQVF
jgi:hypothetical protein